MIRTIISRPAQPQFLRHIHIALLTDLIPTFIFLNPLHQLLLIVLLPGRAAVHAAYFFAALGLGPLSEASHVDVVAAGGFAPYYFFFSRKFSEADWAVAFDGFAV